MKKTLVVLAIAGLSLAGCRFSSSPFDITPPAAPRGLQTFAGESLVDLSWFENTEHDLAGYNIYVGKDARGSFKLVGTARTAQFVDRRVVNGRTYYYAVSAFDFDGNESELCVDVTGATPRPEGRDVFLLNYRTNPSKAGYDFSTYSVGPYDDKYTDIFFEYFNGVMYMNVWDDTDIQDMGYTTTLHEIRVAPENGWSPTKDVQVIVGHTYVVWTWDNHFAKFRVISMSSQRVVFDWAYQLSEGNPFLKRNAGSAGERGPVKRAQTARH